MSRTKQIETLEIRRLLAGFAGDTGIDIFDIFVDGNTTHVVIDGVDHTTNDLAITIDAGEGNDQVFVNSTRVNSDIVVNAGGGDDLLLNGNANFTAAYRGDFDFRGDAGRDRVVVDNAGDSATGNDVSIVANRIVENLASPLSYDSVERLSYNDGSGSSTIRFGALQGTGYDVASVTLSGQDGDDIFTNLIAGSSEDYLPPDIGTLGIVIDGGNGTDALRLNNALDIGALYTFTSNAAGTLTMQLDSSFYEDGPIEFVGESFELVQTPGNDVTELDEKPSSMSMLIEAGSGNDTIRFIGGDIDDSGFLVSNTSIFGGAGIDSISFDDRLDAEAETETYTFEQFRLYKGTAGFFYTGIDSQTLLAANGVAGPVPISSSINFVSLNGAIGSTTVTGGNTRQNIVNVGNGDLLSLSGTFTINLQKGSINVNDQNDTGNDNYDYTPTQMVKTAGGSTQMTINHSGETFFTINANSSPNNILVRSTAAGMGMLVNGGGGDDTIQLGVGNLAANLLGAISVDGATGTDGLYLNNTLDASPSNQTIDGPIFIDGQTHTLLRAENWVIENGVGGGVMNLNHVTVNTLASGFSDQQTINIGAGNLEANLMNTVTVLAATVVNIDDRLDSGNDAYLVDGQTLRKSGPASASVMVGSNVNTNLLCNDGNNLVQVNQAAQNIHVFGNGGNDRFTVLDTGNGFALDLINIDTGPETISSVEPFGDEVTVNFDVVAPSDIGARVKLIATDTIHRLRVNSVGTFMVPTGVTADIREFIIPGGTIDLAGGALLTRDGGPTQATLQTLLKRGYSNGSWTGTHAQGAINSSLASLPPFFGGRDDDALGFGLGSEIGISTIGGFPIGANDNLVRYTLDGDANLDTRIDISDLGILATNWQQSPRTFSQGDFSYDGIVDITDLGILATSWQKNLPAPSAALPAARGTSLFSVHRATTQRSPIDDGYLQSICSVLGL